MDDGQWMMDNGWWMMGAGCWVLSAGEQENEECDGNDRNNENHKAQETMDMMFRMKFMIKMSMIIMMTTATVVETKYVSVKCVSHTFFLTGQVETMRLARSKHSLSTIQPVLIRKKKYICSAIPRGITPLMARKLSTHAPTIQKIYQLKGEQTYLLHSIPDPAMNRKWWIIWNSWKIQ